MRLYELTAELNTAIERYNSVETDGELAEVEKVLTDLQLSFDQKAVGVAKHILNIEGNLSAVSTEVKRLQAIAKRLEAQRDWFHGYLFRQMEATNTQEVDGVTVKLKIKKNPPSVVVEDETKIPEKYWRVIPEHKEVDKTAIKDAHKAGIGVDGTKVVQGTRLDIR